MRSKHKRLSKLEYIDSWNIKLAKVRFNCTYFQKVVQRNLHINWPFGELPNWSKMRLANHNLWMRDTFCFLINWIGAQILISADTTHGWVILEHWLSGFMTVNIIWGHIYSQKTLPPMTSWGVVGPILYTEFCSTRMCCINKGYKYSSIYVVALSRANVYMCISQPAKGC